MARHFDRQSGWTADRRRSAGTEVSGVVRKIIRYANVKDAPREVVDFPLFAATAASRCGTPPTFETLRGGLRDPPRFAKQSRTDAGLTMFKIKTLEVQTQESLTRASARDDRTTTSADSRCC